MGRSELKERIIFLDLEGGREGVKQHGKDGIVQGLKNRKQ
jgi:hypothetical protein